MNILPSATTEPLPPTPQRAPAEVTPVRPLSNPGQRVAERGPQGSPQEQDKAIERLRQAAEPEQGMSLRGRRAVAAYTSLDRESEQAYMRQVLGFELQI